MITRGGVASLIAIVWIATLSGCASTPRFGIPAAVVSPDGDGFEIPAVHSLSKSVWFTRSGRPRLSRFDVSSTGQLQMIEEIDLARFGDEVTSVAIHGNILAATVAAKPRTANGTVVVLDLSRRYIEPRSIEVGPLPDMLIFVPDGSRLLVANEGEPSDAHDPPGSVSVIELGPDPFDTSVWTASTVALGDPMTSSLSSGWLTPLRNTPPQFVEPEYIAVWPDGSRAAVSCQENNGIAVIDLLATPPAVVQQASLGWVDYSDPATPIDAFDDGVVDLQPTPIRGLRQPDAIAVLDDRGSIRIVTADEGDPSAIWGAGPSFDSEGLEVIAPPVEVGGRVTFGGRGLSLWTEDFQLVHTSVGVVEPKLSVARRTAVDKRSDRRGIEPEGLVAFRIGRRSYVAATLERAGAVALYELRSDRLDLIDVAELSLDDPAAGLAPEGIAWLENAATGSPAGWLLVGDELQGSAWILAISR